MTIPGFSLGGPNAIEFQDVPWDAANFTGNGTITWTVEESDQQVFRVAIVGRVAIVQISLQNTTVQGAGTELYITLPFVTIGTLNLIRRCLNAATWDDVIVGMTGNQLVLFERTGSNWGTFADGTSFWLDLVVPLEDL